MFQRRVHRGVPGVCQVVSGDDVSLNVPPLPHPRNLILVT